MVEYILKRSGAYTEFLSYKIEDAIKKAFQSENISYDASIFINVLEVLDHKRTIAVEDIQDLIEYELYKNKYFPVSF